MPGEIERPGEMEWLGAIERLGAMEWLGAIRMEPPE